MHFFSERKDETTDSPNTWKDCRYKSEVRMEKFLAACLHLP